jgi:hypothetical protein
MIEYDVEQGSDAWRALHLGIPSASSFDKIITPAKGLLSASHRTYLYQLAAEALTLEPTISFDKSQWMDRGTELEPEAVEAYELQEDLRTRKVGFITTDDGQCGASPDRFVINGAGDIIGGLECKCPAPHTQIDYWENGFGTDYKVQVQGQNYVGELEWTDKWSYHPAFPRVLVRCYRDEPFIALMAAALREFNDKRLALIEKLKATGMFETKRKPKTPVEQAYDDGSMPDWMSLDPNDLADRIRA